MCGLRKERAYGRRGMRGLFERIGGREFDRSCPAPSFNLPEPSNGSLIGRRWLPDTFHPEDAAGCSRRPQIRIPK